VVVADDDELLRFTLRELIAADARYEFAGEAADAVAAIELCARCRPDVALVDVNMPGGGLEAVRGIVAASPGTKCVALSGYDDRASVLRMLEAGAGSYIVKGVASEVILSSIGLADAGGTSLSTGPSNTVTAELRAQMEQATRDGALRERIAHAVQAGEFAVLAQPVVSLGDRRVIGAEALVRFTGLPASPATWFAEAESLGLGPDLEYATAERALDQARGHTPGIWVSINLSPVGILRPRFEDLVARAGPVRLMVEITEHAQVQDYAALRAGLEPLRAAGGMVAVDDAGSGYASLQHILELQPDVIKLDAALVRGIETDRQRLAITKSLCAFAEAVDTLLIAEGIETPGQLEALAELGVAAGQGYLLGAPQPWPELSP
jgi:EAL domain-containing protein (putative c-di-GMP-specific phosphodiesterase class I)/AmiR/NasT family two-component response regulator